MKIEWSPFALDDRSNIFDYIESESPSAAITVDDRIAVQIDDLARFPEIGRPGRVEGTRELVVTRTPYVVAYRSFGEHGGDPAHTARSAAVA